MYAVASELFGVHTKFTCALVALATVRSDGAFSDCACITSEPIIPIKNAKENCFIRMHQKDHHLWPRETRESSWNLSAAATKKLGLLNENSAAIDPRASRTRVQAVPAGDHV